MAIEACAEAPRPRSPGATANRYPHLEPTFLARLPGARQAPS